MPSSMQRPLAPGKPDNVGMSAVQLEKAVALLDDAIAAGAMTAASIAVCRGSSVVLSRGVGHSCMPGREPVEVHADSTFLLASISKAFAALSLMVLVDRGLVSLRDPVEAFLPEFLSGRGVLVRDLLAHTAGLPLQLPEDTALRRAHAPLAKFTEAACTTALVFEPQTDWAYCNQGVLLAGEIVERLTGLRLRDFQDSEIFGPLGMASSSLGLGGRSISETVWCGTELGREDSADAVEHDYTANRFAPSTNLGAPECVSAPSGRDCAYSCCDLLPAVLTGGNRATHGAACTPRRQICSSC